MNYSMTKRILSKDEYMNIFGYMTFLEEKFCFELVSNLNVWLKASTDSPEEFCFEKLIMANLAQDLLLNVSRFTIFFDDIAVVLKIVNLELSFSIQELTDKIKAF